MCRHLNWLSYFKVGTQLVPARTLKLSFRAKSRVLRLASDCSAAYRISLIERPLIIGAQALVTKYRGATIGIRLRLCFLQSKLKLLAGPRFPARRRTTERTRAVPFEEFTRQST